MKKLIVFDLDGTLAVSKSAIDAEMTDLLTSLLAVAKVSVISGGSWAQFEKQVIAKLPQDDQLKIYFSFPLVEQSFINTQAIGQSSIPKTSPQRKRRKSSVR